MCCYPFCKKIIQVSSVILCQGASKNALFPGSITLAGRIYCSVWVMILSPSYVFILVLTWKIFSLLPGRFFMQHLTTYPNICIYFFFYQYWNPPKFFVTFQAVMCCDLDRACFLVCEVFHVSKCFVHVHASNREVISTAGVFVEQIQFCCRHLLKEGRGSLEKWKVSDLLTSKLNLVFYALSVAGRFRRQWIFFPLLSVPLRSDQRSSSLML